MGQGRGSRVDAVMAQHFEPTMREFVLAFEQVSDALGDKVECLQPLRAMSQISRLVLASDGVQTRKCLLRTPGMN